MNTYSEGIVLIKEPLIALFENIISPQECTGRNCWIAHRHNDTIADLTARISRLVNIPLGYAESLQMIQ